MQETILEIYKKIQSGEYDKKNKANKFIKNCFKYGYLKENPDEEHKKWFKDVWECEYPVYPSDIPEASKKELKKAIKCRKEEEKAEEKWKQQRYERGYSDCDTWNIFSWFLDIMPKMLQEMRDNLHGFPSGIMTNNQAVSNTALDDNAEEEPGFTKWKETLDRMIFLLKEMNEETCSFENPYEKEFDEINDDFRKKYGFMGEGLKSEEEKEKEKKKHSSRMYFPEDFPDLYPTAKDISYNYNKYELYKNIYMNQCREEFFNLFSKYFYSLWD